MVHKTYPNRRSMPSDRTPSTKPKREQTGVAKGAEILGPVAPRPESELRRAREVVSSYRHLGGSTFAAQQEWRDEIMSMLGLR